MQKTASQMPRNSYHTETTVKAMFDASVNYGASLEQSKSSPLLRKIHAAPKTAKTGTISRALARKAVKQVIANRHILSESKQ